MKSGLDATPLFLLDDLLKKKHIAVKAFCRVAVEFRYPRYLNTTTTKMAWLHCARRMKQFWLKLSEVG